MFSRVRRWLEVTTKLQEVVVPSCNCAIVKNGASCPVVDASNDIVPRPACPCMDPLFLNKLDGSLGRLLLELAQSVLTERQKFLLVSAAEELRWDSMTLTRLCERLSRELKMSYSTVKWNVKRLKVMKLVCGGTEKSKGTSAHLTPLGQLIAATQIQENSRTREST